MKPILIIAAMPVEISLLKSALSEPEKINTPAFEYIVGKLGTLNIVISDAGVGKINAAAATAVLIEKYRPRLVINTGCAGAYIGSGLSVGNLAVASEEFLVDEGVIVSDGWKDLCFMDMPSLDHRGRKHFNGLSLSRHASEKAMQLADYYGVLLMRGPFATVSTCSGTLQRGKELADRWNVIAENMEGAAVAQVCLRYGVDCLQIRGISNMVAERDMLKWDITLAVEAAQRFVLKYLEEMDRPDTSLHPKAVPEL